MEKACNEFIFLKNLQALFFYFCLIFQNSLSSEHLLKFQRG